MAMTRQNLILTAAGSVAAITSMLAGVVLWVLVTNPVAVADSALAHQLDGQSHVAMSVLYDIVVRFAHVIFS
jgi:hypothetical protein